MPPEKIDKSNTAFCDENTFTVFRYPNRKLFITGSKAYTNLSHIAERIRKGERMIALDRKTGDDITDYVLAQICALETSRGDRRYDSKILLSAVSSAKEETRVKIREEIDD